MDLAAPLRVALVGDSAITNELTAYAGDYPVFTRRPVPEDAPYPMIVVSPDVAIDEQDGINFNRQAQVRDIAVYGKNNSAEYRAVETLAYAIRSLFHRNSAAISVSGYNVIDIVTSGPIPAPTDDNQTVGRMVTLTVRMNPTS